MKETELTRREFCIVLESFFLARSDGYILLQRRSLKKSISPDCFECSCAFHVTFGESYGQAAARELEEEIGISALLTYLGKFSIMTPRRAK